MTGGPYFREHARPDNAVRVRVFDASTCIAAGSQLFVLSSGGLVIVPPENAPGSIAVAREYRPDGTVIWHPDIPLIKQVKSP